ncbi:unnamed protein product [Amoebophrya sp. A25]|nr:unnamed protein product [Amoebophrya sp. A25]|eukprot:GSA25T00002712001.1
MPPARGYPDFRGPPGQYHAGRAHHGEKLNIVGHLGNGNIGYATLGGVSRPLEPLSSRLSEINRLYPVIFVLCTTIYFWAAFLFCYLIPSLNSGGVSPGRKEEAQANGPWFVFTTVLFLYCYRKAILTDPGTIPDSQAWRQTVTNRGESLAAFLVEKKKDGYLRYCKWCNKYKPDRAHHCRVLGRCVLKMDHHCPWVSNTIGFHNHKYFLLTLFYATATLSILFSTLLPFAIGVLKGTAELGGDQNKRKNKYMMVSTEQLPSSGSHGRAASHYFLGGRLLRTLLGKSVDGSSRTAISGAYVDHPLPGSGDVLRHNAGGSTAVSLLHSGHGQASTDNSWMNLFITSLYRLRETEADKDKARLWQQQHALGVRGDINRDNLYYNGNKISHPEVVEGIQVGDDGDAEITRTASFLSEGTGLYAKVNDPFETFRYGDLLTAYGQSSPFVFRTVAPGEPYFPAFELFHLIFATSLSALLGTVVSGFFLFHLYLVSINSTTIEFCEKSRTKSSHDHDKGEGHHDDEVMPGDRDWSNRTPTSIEQERGTEGGRGGGAGSNTAQERSGDGQHAHHRHDHEPGLLTACVAGMMAPGGSQYDVGCCGNFRAALGPYFLCWPFPATAAEGDGVIFLDEETIASRLDAIAKMNDHEELLDSEDLGGAVVVAGQIVDPADDDVQSPPGDQKASGDSSTAQLPRRRSKESDSGTAPGGANATATDATAQAVDDAKGKEFLYYAYQDEGAGVQDDASSSLPEEHLLWGSDSPGAQPASRRAPESGGNKKSRKYYLQKPPTTAASSSSSRATSKDDGENVAVVRGRIVEPCGQDVTEAGGKDVKIEAGGGLGLGQDDDELVLESLLEDTAEPSQQRAGTSSATHAAGAAETAGSQKHMHQLTSASSAQLPKPLDEDPFFPKPPSRQWAKKNATSGNWQAAASRSKSSRRIAGNSECDEKRIGAAAARGVAGRKAGSSAKPDKEGLAASSSSSRSSTSTSRLVENRNDGMDVLKAPPAIEAVSLSSSPECEHSDNNFQHGDNRTRSRTAPVDSTDNSEQESSFEQNRPLPSEHAADSDVALRSNIHTPLDEFDETRSNSNPPLLALLENQERQWKRSSTSTSSSPVGGEQREDDICAGESAVVEVQAPAPPAPSEKLEESSVLPQVQEPSSATEVDLYPDDAGKSAVVALEVEERDDPPRAEIEEQLPPVSSSIQEPSSAAEADLPDAAEEVFKSPEDNKEGCGGHEELPLPQDMTVVDTSVLEGAGEDFVEESAFSTPKQLQGPKLLSDDEDEEGAAVNPANHDAPLSARTPTGTGRTGKRVVE